jgi:hypothetical protein
MERRVFFGRLAGGGAAAALGVGGVWFEPVAIGAQRTVPAGDPVLAAVLAEARRVADAFRARQPRADDYRAGAASLRLLGALATERQWDGLLGDGLRRAIDRMGRGEVVERTLKAVHEHGLGHQATVPAVEARLPVVMRGGLPARLEARGRELEVLHREMINRIARSGTGWLVRVQNPYEDLTGTDPEQRCRYLRERCEELQIDAAIACGLAMIPILGTPLYWVCVGLGAAVALYCGAYRYYCPEGA